MDQSINQFFATTAKGLEDLLTLEIQQLGINDYKSSKAGVYFDGSVREALSVCLWSRIANRILLQLKTFDAPNEEQLYEGIQSINWSSYLNCNQSFAIDCSVNQSQITHNKYAALKTKDAIVDQIRDKTGERPNVETESPDVRLNLYIHRDKATISLDLSGESLHKRGYRMEGEHAPLKETLAAALLLRSQWPKRALSGEALIDPMCGSGTLLIEAALIAADIAPGLMRKHYGFFAWQEFDDAIWDSLLNEAKQRRAKGLQAISSITGYDSSKFAINAATKNIKAAGLENFIHLEKREISEAKARKNTDKGLLIVNPPYGIRLSNKDDVAVLYELLGKQFQIAFEGWDAAVFTDSLDLAKNIPLRAHKIHTLYNGSIECKLLHFHVNPKFYFDTNRKFRFLDLNQRSENAQMFENRLKKNVKHLRKWANREGISCYRIYDADLPEYAMAIDLYLADEPFLVVQEYEAPASIDKKIATHRLNEALSIATQYLDIEQSHLFIKQRRQQKGKSQYEKQDTTANFHIVKESCHQFYVNFTDYLDTGLFLDHRITRQLIGDLANGKQFLNLFAYTSTASVYAAKAGALSTTSVDMSNTYIDWSARNFELNEIYGENHEFIRADCLQWIKQQKNKYDLIFLDPPSFSNSKKMDQVFSIQDQHVSLIEDCMAVLNQNGILIFSNNLRNFKLDVKYLSKYHVENITERTIPQDFKRNQKIHHCWKISKQ